MRRSPTFVIALAIIVLLAGCAGGPAPSTDAAPTSTDAGGYDGEQHMGCQPGAIE
jgi:PBP1b-binding outer membrane lipoprotein LpoB